MQTRRHRRTHRRAVDGSAFAALLRDATEAYLGIEPLDLELRGLVARRAARAFAERYAELGARRTWSRTG